MECGVVPNGVNVFPWLVKVVPLRVRGVPNFLLDGGCGGSFISNQHVITAKHCIEKDFSTYYVIFNGHPYEAEVVNYYKDDRDCGRTDMAILRLTRAPRDRVVPICLPKVEVDSLALAMNDENLTMASFRGGYHTKSMPVWTCYKECESDREGKGKKGFNNLCSKYMVMPGDSGSPLMRKNNGDVWTLSAIVISQNYDVNDTFLDSEFHTIFPRLSWVLNAVKNTHSKTSKSMKKEIRIDH